MLVIRNISYQFTEAKTVDATNSFQEKMPQQDKVVEGPLRVSTAEQTTNHSPGQEEKEERNINVTTISDELKPELDPGETSPIIDNAEVGKEQRNVKVTTAADVPKPERNIGQKVDEIPNVTKNSSESTKARLQK